MELSQLSEDASFIKRLPASYYLESAYQGNLQKSTIILKDEDIRRERLRILFLEDEKKELNEKLVTGNGRVEELECDRAKLQLRSLGLEADLRGRDTEMRKQARELSDLRAELEALNGISVDSAKFLAEKLSLMRELSVLKPELESLRAQEICQQSVLADKLSLQRQLNMLEIELEEQKRISKRLAKDSDDEKEGLREAVDALQKELSQERRDKQGVEKRFEEESHEWETSKSKLESTIDQLRTKLQKAKNKQEEFQTQLSEREEAAGKLDKGAPTGKLRSKGRGKRNASQMSADAAIGTPDGGLERGKRPAAKNGKSDITAVGEKSMFSITPFLNRTMNIITESPPQEQSADESREQETGEKRRLNPRKRKPSGKEIKSRTDSASPALLSIQRMKVAEKNDLQAARGKLIDVDVPNTTLPGAKSLEKVTGNDENLEQDQIGTTVGGQSPLQASVAVLQKPAVKKKRKLLGRSRTIFEEENVIPKCPSKLMPGPPLPGLLESKVSRMDGIHASAIDDTVVFSPLKKDRKGTQTSFLL